MNVIVANEKNNELASLNVDIIKTLSTTNEINFWWLNIMIIRAMLKKHMSFI